MPIKQKVVLQASITAATKLNPPLNGPVHIECKLLRHVFTSAAEAETAGLFHNYQKVIEIKQMLRVLGQLQGAVPVNTDNMTAASFDTICSNRKEKSWDVHFHLLSEQQLF